MKLATPMQYAGDVVAAARQVSDWERAGLDQIWVAEAYGFDAVSLMGFLAATTERVEICSGILSIYSRTPATLAMTAAGLDAVSDGRFVLGLGASGPQVVEGWHGVPYDRPVQRTREIIEVVRRMLRREVIEHDGVFTLPLPPDQGLGLGKPLKMLTTPVRSEVPIHVAALGRRNVAMAAEVADGWLPVLYMPEKATEVWGAALAEGRDRRSDHLAPLEVTAGAMLAVAEGDARRAILDLARPMVALYVGGMGARGRNFYNDLFCTYGWEAEAAEIQDLYLDGRKDEAAAAVPFEALELMNLVGSEGQIKERIAAFRDSGVTRLNIVPVDAEPARLIERVKGWIS